MTAAAPVAGVVVPPRTLSLDLRAVKVVVQRDLIRTYQDRTRFISQLIQPVLFLFVLGSGLSSLTGSKPYSWSCSIATRSDQLSPIEPAWNPLRPALGPATMRQRGWRQRQRRGTRRGGGNGRVCSWGVN